MSEPPATTQRIANVTLDEHTVVRRSADIEHERRVAIFDLLEDNSFAPEGLDAGPYHLHLAIEDNRLAMHINDTNDQSLERVMVPVSPYRRLIKDYFTVCESYFEAIDMGRRALHNEGSDMLREQLADKVRIDDDTARRLFTLLCVLHIRA